MGDSDFCIFTDYVGSGGVLRGGEDGNRHRKGSEVLLEYGRGLPTQEEMKFVILSLWVGGAMWRALMRSRGLTEWMQ